MGEIQYNPELGIYKKKVSGIKVTARQCQDTLSVQLLEKKKKKENCSRNSVHIISWQLCGIILK